ncbi:MAG: DUF4340 domain-containing protein [Oligoflexales bacterium]|nr:DUF4340 domain-containing protein [Oligoflexales bacterium]
MSNSAKQLTFLGIFAVLVGGLLWWDDTQTAKEEKNKSNEKKLSSFQKELVQELIYESYDVDQEQKRVADSKKIIRLKKNAQGDWYLFEPLEIKADAAAVEDFLTSIESYQYERKIESSAGLAAFGLEPPLRTIELRFNSDTVKSEQEPIVIHVGDKAPVGYSVYIKNQSENQVFLGGQYFLVSTAKTVRDFREKSLAKIDLAKLARISYKRSGAEAIKIEKKADVYQIVSPDNYLADQNEVEDLIKELNAAIIEEFNDQPTAEAKTPFTSELAETQISWSDATGAETSLFFITKDANLWAAYANANVLFRLNNEFRSKIEKTLFNFRDRKIFSFNSSDVNLVDVDGQQYQLKNDNWYLASDLKSAGDADKALAGKNKDFVRYLLVDLEFAKTEAFLSTESQEVKNIAALPPKHALKLFLKNKADQKSQELGIDFWSYNNNGEEEFIIKTNSGGYFAAKKNILDALLNPEKSPEESPNENPENGKDMMLEENSEPSDPG